MKNRQRLFLRHFTASLVLAFVTAGVQAKGQIINVQFSDGTNPNEELNGEAWSSTISPLAYTGTVWSQGLHFSATDLPDSDGNATTVGYQSGATQVANNGVSPLNLLTETYYSVGTATLTITGLDDSKAYDLYLPSAFDGKGSTFTVGTQSQTTTGDASGSSFVEGVNYVELTDLRPVGNSLTVDVTAGSSGLSIVEGFQLTAAAVPEPSTYAMMLGGLCLIFGMQRFRKGAK